MHCNNGDRAYKGKWYLGKLIRVEPYDDIAKSIVKSAAAAPIGSIRVFADGRYRKEERGWVRIAEGRRGSSSQPTASARSVAQLKTKGSKLPGLASMALAPATMDQNFGASYAYTKSPKQILNSFFAGGRAASTGLHMVQKLGLAQRLDGNQWFQALQASNFTSAGKRVMTLGKEVSFLVENVDKITKSLDVKHKDVIHKLATQFGGWKKFNKLHWDMLLESDYKRYLEYFTKYNGLDVQDYKLVAVKHAIPERNKVYHNNKITYKHEHTNKQIST